MPEKNDVRLNFGILILKGNGTFLHAFVIVFVYDFHDIFLTFSTASTHSLNIPRSGVKLHQGYIGEGGGGKGSPFALTISDP